MDRLRFFLKLAFICNLCFLLAELSYYIDYKGHFEEILKMLLPMGLIVAFPLNIIVLIVTSFRLYRRRITWRELPPYVFVINLIILLFQFYFLF